jgi:hypothetical protein
MSFPVVCENRKYLNLYGRVKFVSKNRQLANISETEDRSASRIVWLDAESKFHSACAQNLSSSSNVFKRKIKNCFSNDKINRCNGKSQSDTKDTFLLHRLGEDNSRKSVLDGFVLDDWWSKILLNLFNIRYLVKSKRRSELRHQLFSLGI